MTGLSNDKEQSKAKQLEAMDKIQAIIEEYNLGGIVVLGDNLGGITRSIFPSWSAMQNGCDDTRIIKTSPDKKDEACATVDLLIGLKNICLKQVKSIGEALHQWSSAMDDKKPPESITN